MKKYVLIILIIGAILGGILGFNTYRIQEANKKVFSQAGYILQPKDSGNTQNVERYYFNEKEKYKTNYNNQVSFKDTNGQEIKTSEENFIHYTEGSVSALKDGVLMELNELERKPIEYYNIGAGKILTKEGTSYVISNLNKELKFYNFVWKISNNKYLLVGNSINIVFDDGTNKQIDNGYVELEYTDNAVVKIYNQEVTYQTISSKVYIEMPNNVKLNVASKIFSKDNDEKMSLENMVINADDNINIVELNKDKKENEKKNEIENAISQGNGQGQNTNSNTQSSNSKNTNTNNSNSQSSESNVWNQIFGNSGEGNTNTQGENQTDDSSIQNGNTTGNTIINSGDQTGTDNTIGGSDAEQETPDAIKVPEYTVEKFDVTALGLNATISVNDTNQLLTDDSRITIYNKDNGKLVYDHTEAQGIYSINLEVQSLLPDTNYLLQIESSYKVNDVSYTKNFVYKTFRTSAIGISVDKNVFTNTSMSFMVNFDTDSKAKSAQIEIVNGKGETVQTQSVVNKGRSEQVDFTGLTANTEYTIKVSNVLYDGEVITNGTLGEYKFKTLKNKPEISGTEFEIDKRNSQFKLKLKNVKDDNYGITGYRFEIYDTRNEEDTSTPVKTIETDKREITVDVDNKDLYREVGYTFKVIAIFNDNEKIYEYESEYSQVMKLDGVEFPTVDFETKTVTYERIIGTLKITDKGNAIKLSDDTLFTVVYTDSVGISRSFTSQGSLLIPVDVNNLRANETYKFSVYTNVDLQDGNPAIDECYIGGAIVKTGVPNNMRASFEKVTGDVKTTFNVRFQLGKEKADQGTLEPETLTGMTFSIYSGQAVDDQIPAGSPIKEIQVTDNNTKPYESDLKTKYFDNFVNITPEFFRLNNSDFKDKYYTIVAKAAYDYTDYQNNLPIVKNIFTVATNGYMPDLPTDVNNALNVTTIRNKDVESPRQDLSQDTVVGYRVKANYDNSGKFAKKITYKIFNKDTGELIDTKVVDVPASGLIPEATFDVKDGTPISTVDTDVRRGNSYYFTYEADLDLDLDGTPDTKYPYKDKDGNDVVLKSKDVTPNKELPNIVLYQSTSDNSTATFKYKLQDVDQALETKDITATIGGNYRSQASMTLGNTDFEPLTFTNLIPGDLKLTVSQSLVKAKGAETVTLISEYFEGITNVNNVKYKVNLTSNRVVITLLDDGNSQIDKIAALKVELEAKDKSSKVEKDLKKPSSNIVGVDLNDLGDLLNKETEVRVTAYYDSGKTGFDLEGNHYIALQKAYTSKEDKYYLALNKDNNLVENPSIVGNIYESARTDNKFAIRNPIDRKLTTQIELQYSENGFLYGYTKLLPKQIDEQSLVPEGNNTIYFNKIIPGISMRNDKGDIDIKTELSKATFNAQIISKNEIIGNIIYIEVYETDENGNGQKLVKTVQKTVDEFNSAVELSDLNPKTYYFIKFKANIYDGMGGTEEKYLYDIDDQVEGKQYYFSTLANVGITDVKVTYNPVKYNNKTLDITYKLDKIMGYTKIQYNLYKKQEDGSFVNTGFKIDDDTLFLAEMKKQLNANPGTDFDFGGNYKIEIIPIADIQDATGATKELELGKVEQEFTLKKLAEPVIAIKGSREAKNTVKFNVTIYDYDRIIQNDKYKVKILDSKLQDVTPEKYKGEFDTDGINTEFLLENVDQTEGYTIQIITMLDFDNDAKDLVEFKKEYRINAVNKYGISLGTLSGTKNDKQPNKVDVIFNGSYKLTDIDNVKYSIYNTNGFAKSGSGKFVPTLVESYGDSYYKYSVDENLDNTGTYYIELQFYKGTELIETATVEYIYLDN